MKKYFIYYLMFIVSIVAVVGASYAFFNFTKTGEVNLFSTGTISFTSNYDRVELQNVFPISMDDVDTDDVNAATIELNISGYTDYEKGFYFRVTAQDINATVYDPYDEYDYTILSVVSTSEGLDNVVLNEYINTSDIEEGSVLAYGRIPPNTQVNGKITFKVFLCSEYIAISDTVNYDTSIWSAVPIDEKGTTEEWLEGPEGWRILMTTEQWNNLAVNPLGFKIKVESVDYKSYIKDFPQVITNQKNNIHEIYFEKMSDDEITTRYNAATYKADVSMLGDSSVKSWLEGDKLYVASSDTIYLHDGFDFSGFWETNTSPTTCEIRKIIFNNVNTSGMTSMIGMFNQLNKLAELDVSKFDTSNVRDMDNMFSGCSSLTELDLSTFNTSKTIYMNAMFNKCTNISTLDLSSFETSHVKMMSGMLTGCGNLITVYVSELWNTTSLAHPNNSFFGNTNFGYTTSIVGGEGTIFSLSHVDSEYARIDDPSNGKPGYFTYKAHS